MLISPITEISSYIVGMWILLALLLLLLLIIIWLLWARMVLCINSYTHQYFFSFGGLIKLEPVHQGQDILLAIKLPFYRFELDPFDNRPPKKPKKGVDKPVSQKKSPAAKGRKLKFTIYLKTAGDVLKTFTVRRFKLDLDTGDFVLNAKLTPVVVFLSRGPAQLQVNYLGRTDIWIEIENQLIRLVPLVFRLIRMKYL